MVLTPAHLAALVVAFVLGREEVLQSMGVSAEALFDYAAPVLRLRLTALYGWYALLLLALLTSTGAAQGASYLLYWASMLVDGLFFMTAAVIAAHRSRSEAAGALAGIAFWVACSLLGKAPPKGMPWLSQAVPLGPHLWMPWTVILAGGSVINARCAVLIPT